MDASKRGPHPPNQQSSSSIYNSHPGSQGRRCRQGTGPTLILSGRQSRKSSAPRPSERHSPSRAKENELARSVTTISRQLLDSFAFSQVDNLVGDLAHMREYLIAKFPDPEKRPLTFESDISSASRLSSNDAASMIAEYKGALYGRRCLITQQIIAEYLLGKCLQQCKVCVEELVQTKAASREAELSANYLHRYGSDHGVKIDIDSVDSESASMFKKVRRELYDLSEELKYLDGSREVAAEFCKNPLGVLRTQGLD